MGLIPKFVTNAVHTVEHAGGKVLGAVEHPLRTAQHVEKATENLGKTVVKDGFDLANKVVMPLTSSSDKQLVRKELGLAQVAKDPHRSQADRTNAREEMRRLMGAEPSNKLDPLPASCSAAAENKRLASAKVWNPSQEPSSTKAQWASTDAAGREHSDPVNFYVHGNLSDIVRDFQKGGWSIAEPNNSKDDSAYAGAMATYAEQWAASKVPFFGQPVSQSTYHAVNRMPVSDLYLNGQKELVAMEANNHPATGRDHFRIFWTGKKDAQGRPIYAVAASRDAGLKLDPTRPQTGFTNHFTQKDADAERDFALDTLLAGGATVQVDSLHRDFANGPKGGLYSGDGKVYDVTL